MREGFPGVLKRQGFIYASSQHTPDQLIPLHISLNPLVSCPKVETFGYQDHQEERYSTPDSGSHLRHLIDSRSQRLSSRGTTSPLVPSQKIPTQAQRPPPRSSLEDFVEPWAPFVSKASCRIRHSTTPERSYHLLVKSPRMVEAFLTNLFLLEKPLGWHLRQLGSPWPVLDLGCLKLPHR